jgi:hypothetical protein
MRKSVLLLPLTLIAVGCQSTGSGGLYNFGEQQAISGYELLDRIDVKKKMLRQKVTIEEYLEYKSGYENGLKTYCQDKNAITYGANGKEYNGICDNINPNFKVLYKENYKSE